MYIPAEGTFRFLFKNNFRFLQVAIFLVGVCSFCNCGAFLTFLVPHISRCSHFSLLTFLVGHISRSSHFSLLTFVVAHISRCSHFSFLTFLSCSYTALRGNIQQTFRRAYILFDKTD
jgi:hypothetical protein